MTARLWSRDGCVQVRRAGVTRLVHTCYGYLPRYVQPYLTVASQRWHPFRLSSSRRSAQNIRSVSKSPVTASLPLPIHLLTSHGGRRNYQECILSLILGRVLSCSKCAGQMKLRMGGQIELPPFSSSNNSLEERALYSRLFLYLISRTCQGFVERHLA